ncbi:hypothetical protein JKF63_06399 [Porcisia hertigi]|uniref:Uncharacterized protein n=1 Tax=Porcisia hertigi TaxID=2761500 RepID=A0A836LJV1_9TRYP|nr:hypothetical protein JKF63_06399 [Porcisia hertigi]
MSMQLFTFGHPCEYQLHRACIGGSNCPLNGYPDTWCCSFIKGKINFKRDRPCEGLRCHWDYVHPSHSQFEEVTQVLEQSRPIAAKLDEASDTDLLSFNISNPHIIDTVQCALHMMRHPPSACARRVGQLLAYAAVLAGEQDIFVQLLKTMKKPVDGYILGAYAFLTQGKGASTAGASKVGSTSAKKQKKKDGKEDITPTLANIMVELMNAALSLGGQLVDREDQHMLQAMLIKALSTYPKNDKRHQDMLEKAIAKFGHRKLEDEEEAAAVREVAKREAATAASTAAAPPPVVNQQPTDSFATPSNTASATVPHSSDDAECATGEGAIISKAPRSPAAATATTKAEAAAAPGAPATTATALGTTADASINVAAPRTPSAAFRDAVTPTTGTASPTPLQFAGAAVPKATPPSVTDTPNRAADLIPDVTVAVTAADAAQAPITFSTATQGHQSAAASTWVSVLSRQPTAPSAPGTPVIAAGAPHAAPQLSQPRSAIIGISRLHPYLAGCAAKLRNEAPSLLPIYDPHHHTSGLFICGGLFSVDPLGWNAAPLGDAALNRRLGTPSREPMRIKERVHQWAKAAKADHLLHHRASTADGKSLFTSELVQQTVSTGFNDSIDSWINDDADWRGSSSESSFD